MSTLDSPWMLSKIRKLRKYKVINHKRARRTNKAGDWEKFRVSRNKVSTEIHDAKEAFEQKQAEKIKKSHGTDEKLWWKLTKRFYNKKKNNRHQSPPVIHDWQPRASSKEKANIFNNYFCKHLQTGWR